MSTNRRAPRGVQRLAQRVRNGAVRVRNLANRVAGGDRPLVVAFLVTFVLAVVMLSGPMQNYLASSDRVALLESQRDALAVANEGLEQQAADLNDPAQLELRAREDGYIRPGEVPYVVVPPEVEPPQITEPAPEPEVDDGLLTKLWRGLTSIFGE